MTKQISNVIVDKISLLQGATPAVPEAEKKFSIVKMFNGIFKKKESVVDRLLKSLEIIDKKFSDRTLNSIIEKSEAIANDIDNQNAVNNN